MGRLIRWVALPVVGFLLVAGSEGAPRLPQRPNAQQQQQQQRQQQQMMRQQQQQQQAMARQMAAIMNGFTVYENISKYEKPEQASPGETGSTGSAASSSTGCEVRWSRLADVKDENNKKVLLTVKQREKLRGNSKLPGYEARWEDLKTDTPVTVTYYRDANAGKDGATPKYVYGGTITGVLDADPTDSAISVKVRGNPQAVPVNNQNQRRNGQPAAPPQQQGPQILRVPTVGIYASRIMILAEMPADQVNAALAADDSSSSK
jgi:type II secretory pathway pseudopilin PulG